MPVTFLPKGPDLPISGVAVGCRPYLVRTGKGAQTEQKALPEGTRVFDNLAAVVTHLLEN